MKTLHCPARNGLVSDAHGGRMLIGLAGLLFTASQFAYAQSSSNSTYEPSSRQRLRAETCMKDEVDQGAYCVKRCDEGFKLEMNGKKPLCRAAKAGAAHKAPPVEYLPPPPPAPGSPPPPKGY